MIRLRGSWLAESKRKPDGNPDTGIDPVPDGSPLQTAQLIGALVIRFVNYAQSGLKWEEFPDKGLMEAILENCKNREVAEQHLVAMLFHHSKILDNCGTPEINLRKLVKDAFPKVDIKQIEAPEWEIV